MKPPPDRAKRSIFLFKLKNPIRQICITVRWQNDNKSHVSYTDPRSWNMFDIQFPDPRFDIQFPDHGSKVVWNLHPVSNHGDLCVFSGESIFLHSAYQHYHVMWVTNYLKLLVFLASALQTMSQLLAIMNNDFYCWIIWQIVNNEFYCWIIWQIAVSSLLWLWFVSYFPSRLD